MNCVSCVQTMWHQHVPLLLLVCIVAISSGQKISQAGSDFYLRFRSQRFVDRPVTTRLHVESLVKHRYAVTEVVRDVHNPANEPQMVEFVVAMPVVAVVSRVRVRGQEMVIEKGDSGVGGDLGGEGFGRSVVDGGVRGSGMDVGSRSVVQFVLPVLLDPEENVTLSLVYENLLERESGWYQHALNLSPGEIIYDFMVRISICENKNVSDVAITASGIDDVMEYVTVETKHENETSILFTMNSREQAHIFGSPGFSGTLLTQFDIRNDGNDVDMAIEDGHFVHFYTVPGQLPPIPKHVIFIVDVSQSMRGSLATVSKTVKKILQSLNPDDYLNIIAFNSTMFEWNPMKNSSSGVNQAFKCLPQVKESGLKFVQGLQARGLSDLVTGLQQGIYTGRKIRESQNFPDNVFTMIVLLTDGHTTRTEVNTERRIRIDNREDRIPIYSLGIGTFSQDERLQRISQKSGGSWHKINPDKDLDVQLNGVLQQFDDVVLKNVNIRYADNLIRKESLTMTEFKAFKTGTSLVVAGKWNQNGNGSIEPIISGQFINGSYVEQQPLFDVVRQSLPTISAKITKHENKSVENGSHDEVQSFPKSYIASNDEGNNASVIERLWAYLTIKEAMEQYELKNGHTDSILVETAANLSTKYNFLTPLTQLVEEYNHTQNIHEFGKLITTRNDNHGNHFSHAKSADDCDPPIKCRAAFGYSEPLPKVIEEGLCWSSLVVTNVKGESLKFNKSTPRVRMVGSTHVSQEGSCCWILYSADSYLGKTQHFCGDNGPLLIPNVKSVRKM